MPRPGNRICIPLPERQALDLLLKVKPTADMPPRMSGVMPRSAQRKAAPLLRRNPQVHTRTDS